MCGCPPFIVKIGLLITILPTIVVNIMEVIFYCVNSTVEEHQIAKNINLVACFIALLSLSFGVYGTVMDIIFIIRVIVMWIVFKNLSPTGSSDVVHEWFQLNTGLSVSANNMFDSDGQLLYVPA
ncbi:uncharacterized protein LOC120448809 isoform X6 [Drosophila santomea]|uniref:uncharacterized protein LOC120448809 isoform X6 n=1 Tax=Drosophila santomea TaxID=129105 RepID=UPI00195374A6|nr:uncharacterized protein LOC120448809 isoform X6 [Drosophila santomea]